MQRKEPVAIVWPTHGKRRQADVRFRHRRLHERQLYEAQPTLDSDRAVSLLRRLLPCQPNWRYRPRTDLLVSELRGPYQTLTDAECVESVQECCQIERILQALSDTAFGGRARFSSPSVPRAAATHRNRSAIVAAVENQLVARLPRRDRLRLISLCTRVEICLGDVLGDPGDTTSNAYFPSEGFISLVSLLDGHQSLEVGMVGREGMVGVEIALGFNRSPVRTLVQGSGTAWRLGAATLRSQMEDSPALRKVLQSYVFALVGQLTTSAACLRFHLIGARLARWLLMTQDRARSEHFEVTHEFLSYMLGARRVSVTLAANQLQRQGLILYRRGHLTVLNRSGLEAAACSCYATDLGTYAASFPGKLNKAVPV